MAATVATMRVRFPEFEQTESGLLASKLEEAEARTNRTLYGEGRADTAVLLLAAHLVAMSPYGEALRLNPKQEPDGACSLYERTLVRMQREVPVVPRLS